LNLLVTYLYDLGKDYPLHRAIHNLCRASYEKNLKSADYFVTLTGAAEGKRNQRYGAMLVEVFGRLRLLHSAGHNLLVVDADTLCVRPTEVFGKWNRLAMFNMANAKVPYGAFPRAQYLHSAVRYIPKEFSLWDTGQELVDRWDYDMWAYDQYVWNAMFWAQEGVEPERAEEYADPRYCYVPLPEYDNLGVPKSEARIVHFGETRGVKNCLEKMKRHAI
jgi:hypothetical protein